MESGNSPSSRPLHLKEWTMIISSLYAIELMTLLYYLEKCKNVDMQKALGSLHKASNSRNTHYRDKKHLRILLILEY